MSHEGQETTSSWPEAMQARLVAAALQPPSTDVRE